MKKFFSGGYVLVLVFFLALGSQPQPVGAANNTDNSIMARADYNLMIMTVGAHWYWEVKGRMPASITEMSNMAMIPTNLINPVTNRPLILDPRSPGPYDITLNPINDRSVEFVLTASDGQLMDSIWDESKFNDNSEAPSYDPGSPNWKAPSEQDRTLDFYLQWTETAVGAYFSDRSKFPESVQDLIDANFWPLEARTNPISGGAMLYRTCEPGDLYFLFRQQDRHGQEMVRVLAHFSDCTTVDAGIYPAQVIPGLVALRNTIVGETITSTYH